MTTTTNKYSVIGSAGQFAAIDCGCSLVNATRTLKPSKFSNGRNALRWMWGFNTMRDARAFVSRCESALAFKSGKLGRWITPTFVAVATAELEIR